jgi:hypothetical protein
MSYCCSRWPPQECVTESLPSNGYTCHNIIVTKHMIWKYHTCTGTCHPRQKLQLMKIALCWQEENIYSVSQKSVNLSENCTLKYVRHFFITHWIYKNSSKKISMFSAQLTNLWHRSTNWLAGLNLNIPVNTWKCFRLLDVWAIPYYL